MVCSGNVTTILWNNLPAVLNWCIYLVKPHQLLLFAIPFWTQKILGKILNIFQVHTLSVIAFMIQSGNLCYEYVLLLAYFGVSINWRAEIREHAHCFDRMNLYAPTRSNQYRFGKNWFIMNNKISFYKVSTPFYHTLPGTTINRIICPFHTGTL